MKSKMILSGYFWLLTCIWPIHLFAQTDKLTSQLQHAYQLAWNQEFDQAVASFDDILAHHPSLTDAKVGKAWALAWEQDYHQARQLFGEILHQIPNHWEAQKGLAYLALWQHEFAESAQRFQDLIRQEPAQADLWMALGLAQIHQGDFAGARNSQMHLEELHFLQSLDLGQAILHAPARLEFNCWGGWSQIDGQTRWGIRALKFHWNVQPKLALWLRYDNSLSLDGSAAFPFNQRIPTYWAGTQFHVSKRATSRVELGLRTPANASVQPILMAEQAIWLKDGLVAKIGGLYELAALQPQVQATEHLAYAGLAAKAGKRFWLDGMFFQTIPQSAQGRETRVTLSGKYHWSSGPELQVGGLLGRRAIASTDASMPIRGCWLSYQHPIKGRHWLHATFRLENGPLEQLLVGALGATFRLEN